jgi:flagellar biogenesis protein FliO
LNDAQAEAQPGNPFSIWAILRIFLVLSLVAAAIYALVFILKKSTRANSKSDPWLKVISFVPLNSRNSAALVSAGGRVFLLGCAEASVNVITEVTDKESVDAMLLDVSEREYAAGKQGVHFGDLLKKLSPNFGSAQNTGALGGGTEKLRAARARLGGI